MFALKRRIAARLLAATVLAVLPTGAAMAQDAARIVDGMAGRILAVVKAGASEEQRRREMTSLFRDNFDIAAIGRLVLGRHWNTATADQREKFMTAFERAEIKAYSDRFGEYAGHTFGVGKVTAHANGTSQLVNSALSLPSGAVVRILWEIAGGKVVDISVEGVSMGLTRRSDFSAFIQQNGMDGLIAALARKGG